MNYKVIRASQSIHFKHILVTRALKHSRIHFCIHDVSTDKTAIFRCKMNFIVLDVGDNNMISKPKNKSSLTGNKFTVKI